MFNLIKILPKIYKMFVSDCLKTEAEINAPELKQTLTEDDIYYLTSTDQLNFSYYLQDFKFFVNFKKLMKAADEILPDYDPKKDKRIKKEENKKGEF